MSVRTIYVLGGGTFNHVRAHLSLAAPAFGTTALSIVKECFEQTRTLLSGDQWNVIPVLTKMADPQGSNIITNDDVERYVDNVILADPNAKIVFFNVAMCDYVGTIGDVASGKYADRLRTSDGDTTICCTPATKVLSKIRQTRKDIFLVGFKTTSGATPDDQYMTALAALKRASCNITFANDLITRNNMIVVPEEARYSDGAPRQEAIRDLVDIALHRSQLHFTRSTVVDGDSVSWNGSSIPDSLRTVVNYCIERGAYKPVLGVTAGHFAFKQSDTEFITSKRKTNFNDLATNGMVLVQSTGPDSVIAHGAKPSVGGMSQRIIFAEHAVDDVDCIVHFHCPTKPGVNISVREQKYFECGSHECGQNTSDGLFFAAPNIKAVYLDHHGPNVVFNHNVDPQQVIAFIERTFDLDGKTGGYVLQE